jgi:selenium-binding protein 1
MDDRFLYVACWGTGEMRQCDHRPETKARGLGPCRWHRSRTAHPSGKVYAGGPQMVEISHDGKRVYWTTHSIPRGITILSRQVPGAEVMAITEAGPAWSWQRTTGVNFPRRMGASKIRLEGGDCSTDSFCYPSA